MDGDSASAGDSRPGVYTASVPRHAPAFVLCEPEAQTFDSNLSAQGKLEAERILSDAREAAREVHKPNSTRIHAYKVDIFLI